MPFCEQQVDDVGWNAGAATKEPYHFHARRPKPGRNRRSSSHGSGTSLPAMTPFGVGVPPFGGAGSG